MAAGSGYVCFYCQSLGAEVNVQVAGGVVEEQISQIEYFIKKKMDVIVVIPIDGMRCMMC